VRVGSVTRIGADINLKDLSSRVPVYLEIDPSTVTISGAEQHDPKATFKRLRAAGLEAQLGTQSLVTGQLRVDLDILPKAHTTLLGGDVDGDEVPSSPSQLQNLEAEIADLPLKQIADNANRTLISIGHVSDALGPRVGPVLDSLKGTSESAHATMDAAHQAVTHIDGVAIDGRVQLKDNGDALRRVLASSDKTVHDADALIASLNEMTEPNSRMRDDLQSATRDLAASASSLRTFTRRIEQNPSDLLKRGKAPK
jgi:paraquat-inducible protein B